MDFFILPTHPRSVLVNIQPWSIILGRSLKHECDELDRTVSNDPTRWQDIKITPVYWLNWRFQIGQR